MATDEKKIQDRDYVDIIAEDIHWIFLKSMTYDGGKSHLAYRDNKLGLQLEYADKKWWWYIDGDAREFRSVETMIEAYNEKQRKHNTYVEVPYGKRVILLDDNLSETPPPAKVT